MLPLHPNAVSDHLRRLPANAAHVSTRRGRGMRLRGSCRGQFIDTTVHARITLISASRHPAVGRHAKTGGRDVGKWEEFNETSNEAIITLPTPPFISSEGYCSSLTTPGSISITNSPGLSAPINAFDVRVELVLVARTLERNASRQHKGFF